jgi:hypothetical protein
MYLLISSLFIDSEWPPLVRFFGPMRHYFNPLKDIDYKKRGNCQRFLYAFAAGETTR